MKQYAVVLFVVAVAGASRLQAAGPFQFYSITPCRLIDTRDPVNLQGNGGPALQHGEIRNLPIWGMSARSCGIPAHALAVAVNVVVMSPTSLGHLVLFPYGAAPPLASAINYNAGEPALANSGTVPLTDNSALQLSVIAGMAGVGNTTHFVLDVTGYFQ
jgi:hypothetical protein